MPNLRVKGLDRDIEVEAGADLRKACIDNHVNLFYGTLAKAINCRGKGFCNLCKVEVLEGQGNLTPPTKREKKRLKDKPETWRLACCAKVTGDIVIDSFPVRHAGDRVSPEALHRAKLPDEELKELERTDWEALKPTHEKPKEKGPKKGILSKVRKAKGIDDEDAPPAPGAPIGEAEEGAEEKPKKKGLLGKKEKKEKGKDKGKGLKVKKGKKAKESTSDADSTEDADKGGKKRFGLKSKK